MSMTELTHYIATGPGAWGRAKTLDEAEKNMAKAYGQMPRCWTVHHVHKSAILDDMGSFTQDKGNPPPKLVKRRGFSTSDDVG
jgi:hypothetical protein